jgi:hypothetical protein
MLNHFDLGFCLIAMLPGFWPKADITQAARTKAKRHHIVFVLDMSVPPE